MHTYLLATLERDAVVGAATATVLKEAMADMMCTRSQCVWGAQARSVESLAFSILVFIYIRVAFYRTICFYRVSLIFLWYQLVRTCGW